MRIDEYSKAALRTESIIPEVKGVNVVSLHAILTAVVGIGEVMDAVKKNVFYGRPYNREQLLDSIGAAGGALMFLNDQASPGGNFADPDYSATISLPPEEDGGASLPHILEPSALSNLDTRLFHVAVGCITESAELAQAILKAMEGKELDVVNFAEEIGDLNWYANGIFPDASGIPAGQTLDTNIGKLVKRFPEKFDGYLAQQENRDLEAERVILENGVLAGEEIVYSAPLGKKGLPLGLPALMLNGVPLDKAIHSGNFVNVNTGERLQSFRPEMDPEPEWSRDLKWKVIGNYGVDVIVRHENGEIKAMPREELYYGGEWRHESTPAFTPESVLKLGKRYVDGKGRPVYAFRFGFTAPADWYMKMRKDGRVRVNESYDDAAKEASVSIVTITLSGDPKESRIDVGDYVYIDANGHVGVKPHVDFEAMFTESPNAHPADMLACAAAGYTRTVTLRRRR